MTTPTRLEWPPGPPPPVDGLPAAFRAADRRRARTAIATAVPVVVAAALAMTMTMQPAGTDSLELPPAKHVTVTRTDQRAPDPVTMTPPRTAAQRAASDGEPLGPAHPRAATAGQAAPAAAPAAAPKPRPAGSLDILAEHTARVQVRLVKDTHPDFFRTVFDRTGRYAGVWVVDADGDVVGSTLEVITQRGKPATRFSTSLPVLTAGTYTVYVAGEGPTEAHIPLQSGEKGLTARATRTVSSSYTTKTRTMGAAETSGSLRMRLPNVAGIGSAGGLMDNEGGVASTVTVCLPHRDAECQSGDPESDGTQFTVGGSVGSVFDLTPEIMHLRRDVLLDTDVHGTSSTELVCWAVVVALA